MNILAKFKLTFLSLIIGVTNGLKFYPFSSGTMIKGHGLGAGVGAGCDEGLDSSIRGTLKDNHEIFSDKFKYSVIGLEHDIEHMKSAMGKQFVINLSSLLPKVDTIGHDVLQANNRFIVDVLSYPNVPDDVKKQIILLSIKLAQYGDDLGSVFLQQYYDLVDRFL